MLQVRTFGLWLLLTAVVQTSFAQGNYVIPKVVEIGESGVIKSQLIYELNRRPTPECHASTIVEKEGLLVAAWFGGSHEKNKDVGIWVSRNVQGTWSKPKEVANGIQDANLRYPCWNPVLYQPDNAPLMLFYKVGPSPSEWWGMVITSEDGGITWSKPRPLGEGRHGKLLGPIKNKPVSLTDGTLISPTSMEFERENEDFWRVYFEVSTDGGNTWEATDFINDGVAFDAIQPSILFHPGKELQILCRTQQGVIAQSWSHDYGKSWSELTATNLPNPNAGTDAVTLMDGRHLLVYNHTTREGEFPKGRNMLNVAISNDGIKWSPIITLERKQGEYSYPSVIQGSRGLVHITYTYQRKSIKYVRIDPRGIRN